jgi:hypothetical protein
MFGKATSVRKFENRPPLSQCERCWKLGHTSNQPTCKLSRDSVRCFTCGKSHHHTDHGAKCPFRTKHTHAGICDCKVKCINCGKDGHNCLDPSCPDREKFHVPTPRAPVAHLSVVPPLQHPSPAIPTPFTFTAPGPTPTMQLPANPLVPSYV